jgi:hypothetical protein
VFFSFSRVFENHTFVLRDTQREGGSLMDTKMYAAILRLQSEQLQKLVRELTAKLVAFEEAVAVNGPASEAITTLHLDGVEELGQNIKVEIERMQNYILQPPHIG